jgi:hypothetical protein
MVSHSYRSHSGTRVMNLHSPRRKLAARFTVYARPKPNGPTRANHARFGPSVEVTGGATRTMAACRGLEARRRRRVRAPACTSSRHDVP